jgi:Divergent InlB B-repeat domain
VDKLSDPAVCVRETHSGVFMKRKRFGKWIGVVGLAGGSALLLSLSSCAHSSELVSIQVQPSVETVGSTDIPVNLDAGSQVQLRALGSYIHPPVTKDITDQVVWASNDTQMFTVSSTGLLSATGQACGGTLVSASVTTNSSAGGLSSSGAVVTGYMTANVVCFTGNGTGGGGGATGPALTVTFAGNGAGTVTSSPLGLSCASPTPCVAEFPSGTVMTLTATPEPPSTFAGWTGCDTPPSTNPCSVTLAANTTVIAAFN